MLATSDIRRNIQENLNVVVTDGRLNDAIVRHVLDTADKNVLANLNLLQITFKDVKKFDAQKLVLGNLLMQIEGSKLSDEETKKATGKNKK